MSRCAFIRSLRRNRRQEILTCRLGLLVAVFAWCFASSAADAKRLHVVTTIPPIYCFASGVIGSEGQVENLLPPNVGPHDYQLTPSDIRKIKEADLLIVNGLGLDDWALKAFADKTKAPILILGSAIDARQLIVSPADLEMDGKHNHSHEHSHAPANPHIWLDPKLALQCVNAISNRVATLNPAFQSNAAAYAARLEKLDAELATQLAAIHSKPFVTQHDAFPYFVRRYDLKQIGMVEPTPDVPPSPRFLADLLKVIREKNVGVIFADPRSSPRLVQQIAKDAKIRTAQLDTLEAGKLDPGAYEEGMRRDAATLVRELK